MRNLSKLVIGSCLFGIALASCDFGSPKRKGGEWPPYANWAQENFEDNRELLELLESMLKETAYNEVQRSIGESALGRIYSEDLNDEEVHIDAPVWSKLLAKSSVFSVVAAEEGYTGYPTGMNPFWDENDYQNFDRHSELIGTLTYIHSPFSDDETPVCRKEFSMSRCGRCVIELAPKWYAFFAWAGSELLPEVPANLGTPTGVFAPESEAESDSKLEVCFQDWDKLRSRLDGS